MAHASLCVGSSLACCAYGANAMLVPDVGACVVMVLCSIKL